MIWTVSEEQLVEREIIKRNAGGKAREDLGTIFRQYGIKEIAIDAPQLERVEASFKKKLLYHYQIAQIWKKEVDYINEGDTFILQFPPINHTLFLTSILKKLKRKGVKLVVFVHDLELLRYTQSAELPISEKWRLKREEIDQIKLFDRIVVHNACMESFLNKKLGIQKSKMYNLELFDYLIDDYQPSNKIEGHNSCIIAGNLLRKKSAYIYLLPEKPDFELYGTNFEKSEQGNIHYHGSFLPEELPNHLTGAFGLVWDGDSPDTCNGEWGNYLRYNNPHKTSLYLACGIPVITWNEAAISDFVLKHDVGITVSKIEEIDQKIKTISTQRYQEMKENALIMSDKIRNGYFTRKALEALQLVP